MLVEQGPAIVFLLLLWITVTIGTRVALKAKPLHSALSTTFALGTTFALNTTFYWSPVGLPVMRERVSRRDRFRASGASPGFSVNVRTGVFDLSERSRHLQRLRSE